MNKKKQNFKHDKYTILTERIPYLKTLKIVYKSKDNNGNVCLISCQSSTVFWEGIYEISVWGSWICGTVGVYRRSIDIKTEVLTTY